ncbi:MAG TPA: hypothetical protein VEX68_13400 [Bryobacteraceae bacterium]|nr:hypothetical protein [Bryobacteraceae bacterium]
MVSRFTLLFALLVGSLSADDTTQLKVEVKTLGDKPIERASVIVDFVEGRSIVKMGKKNMTHWEIRTNQEGIAKLPTMPQGKVRVQVIAKSYQTFGQVYELDAPEKTLVIKLNPPQQQYSAHQ